ncbi:MAG: Helix-turn-helix domain protein [Syntrophorhabdus sp. PtaU1.Bin050]|nr:MAG: Helix-turn-helix domain protein [Syntrophorhabdus sp. PtaU1.Bin050]
MQQFLNEKEVSQLTRFALSTLRNDRSQGRGIPYVKIGKAVRYSLNDVNAFMESHKIETEGK